jgi:hypothetical protein
MMGAQMPMLNRFGGGDKTAAFVLRSLEERKREPGAEK